MRMFGRPRSMLGLSFIVPTIGRESLTHALASIEVLPGDEILVCGMPGRRMTRPEIRVIPCQSARDFGATERHLGMRYATQSHLAFLDDDQIFLPGHREIMQRALIDRPVLFRVEYPNGDIEPSTETVNPRELTAAMIVIPNLQPKFGTWSATRRGAYDFLRTSDWKINQIITRPERLVMMGHDVDRV